MHTMNALIGYSKHRIAVTTNSTAAKQQQPIIAKQSVMQLLMQASK